MIGMYASQLSSVLYPADSAAAVDEANEWTYHTINIGAYKAGFTGSKEYYEVPQLLDWTIYCLDNVFVAGNAETESEIRLLPTLYLFVIDVSLLITK